MPNNLNDLYTFVIRHTDNKQLIKIIDIDSPLYGAVVDITNVTIPIASDPTQIKVSIQYEMVESPRVEEYPTNEQISNVLGQIVMDIMSNHKNAVNFNE